ncbi:MAG: DNA recombination protein RmuC [Actinobacteria bacterium]|nr:DNA recombination protein RmuC [Actinomycetota bacterium]
MNNILFLVLGFVIGAAAIFLSRRQTDLRRTATSSDGRDIEATVAQAVGSALADALETLDQRAQRDRQDSINLASDRVAQASGEQLGRRAEQIDASLRGVQESIGLRIQQMDDEIKRLREQNAEKFGSVDKAVSDLLKSTGDLNNVLSSSQARGQWGERMAEDLLKAAGLIEGINYEKQDTISGGGRPDYTFLMPPDRVLYMDVKFPMDSYTKFVSANDSGVMASLKADFMKAVRDRVKELERRDYVVSTTQQSLDYVLLFVPNESITGFIHEADPSLIDWALERKVVLCSPLTLYAFLVVVRQATESFHTEETAAQIMQMMGKFRKQWESYVKSLDKVKRNFDNMQEELDDLTVGKRFKGLNRETKKIEALRKQHNIPELLAGDDDTVDNDNDADSDDE